MSPRARRRRASPQAENRVDGALSSEPDDSVRALLADVALREQMEVSAGLAERLLRRAAGRVELRPRPHQFAAFHVLRRAETPAVLIEAGYISNADDEAMLMTKEGGRRSSLRWHRLSRRTWRRARHADCALSPARRRR